MQISLCMIVKDEEKFLEKCIKSVLPIVDEIIIVDTGSVDKTKDIARKFNAKIVDFKWIDDFSAAKNESLKHATKEWILLLDADEVIAERDLDKIKKLILNEDVDGYKLIQRNYSNSFKGVSCENDAYIESKGYRSYIPSTLVRLFRNKGYKFQNKIHELIEDSIEQKKERISDSGIPIHHFKDENNDKIKMYLRIGKKQIELTPNNPKPYYEVAKLYESKSNHKLALQYFKESIKLLGSRSGLVINKLIYLDSGITCFRMGNYKEALMYFGKAIENDANNCWPYFYKALILHEENKIIEATEMYNSAIKKGIRDAIAYGNLGDIYLKNKEYQKAFDLFSKACELGHPKKAEIMEVLGKLKR